jgi:hypothetical protein
MRRTSSARFAASLWIGVTIETFIAAAEFHCFE